MEMRQKEMLRFETAEEHEERIKREKEKQEFGDVAVSFTLLKPQPQYIYHTALPDINILGDGNCVYKNRDVIGETQSFLRSCMQ